MAELVLRPPQVPMVDWIMSVKRGGLWAGMGIGKTSAALVALDWLNLTGELDWHDPTLVIGPMRVARDTWPEEVRKWDQFKNLTITPLIGTPEERIQLLKRRSAIFTISYELVPWLVEHYYDSGGKQTGHGAWPFRTVIPDESDRLKGFREKSKTEKRKPGPGTDKTGRSGLRAYHLARIAHNFTDRWINLTGTPAPAGLQDLWGQTWFIDRGERLGRTFGAFQRRWFRRSWDADPEHGKMELMPHSEKEIHEILRDVYLTVDPKDYFNLQEPIYNRLYVNLPASAAKLYKQARDEMYIGLEELVKQGGGINIVNAGVLAQKCLQLANGAIYIDKTRKEWVKVHDEKLEALDSIIHESGGAAIMVAVNFRHDRERILRAFPAAVDLATDDGLRAFKGGKRTIGVAHPKSMGHGIDGLQYICNRIAFFGHNWKTGERMQIIERIGAMRQFQASRTDPVWITDIVARGTEDENVMRVHHENKTVQDVLLEALKRRR